MKWRKIPGFSRYEASETGLLRSTNYKNSSKTKVLKPAVNPRGYPQTMLQNDRGQYKSKPVHYFVTLAFFGPRKKGLTVDHIDGNKQNNHISNLEYVTRSENCKRAVKVGLWEIKHGSKNGNSKLTEQDVKEIREHAKKKGRFYGRKELAKKYNISEAHIKDIVNCRRGIWKYV